VVYKQLLLSKLTETRSERKCTRNNCKMMINGILVLWLSVMANILYNSAEICDANWKTSFTSNGVNNLIVRAIKHSHSVLACSFICRSSEYGSFYYSSALQECYCNTQLDGTANTTTADTGLIYGIRDTQVLCIKIILYYKQKCVILEKCVSFIPGILICKMSSF
jgi:hypothetical protein